MRGTTVPIPTRVLVMGMAHEDGVILAAELYPVAEACGQTPEQVRSCLRRLVSDKWLVRVGSGNRARFEATELGLAALGANIERTRLAYAQDAAGRGWDRQWQLVAYAVPERRRTARDTFRDRLTALGGAAIQGGLYVSAHPWHKDVRAEAERLGVAELVTYAVSDDLAIGEERDPGELARRLWPVDDLAARYGRFIEQFEQVPELLRQMRQRRERLAETVFLPRALSMAVAFQQVFDDDPLLPPELLPRPWPGRTARELLITSRRRALQILPRPGPPALFRLFDEALQAIS